MTFPVVQDADTQSGLVTANDLTWDLLYPTNLAAGDLILVFIGNDGNINLDSISGGLTWRINRFSDGTASLCIAKAVAAGGESGAFVANMGGGEQGCWMVLRVTGWEGTLGTLFGNTVDAGAVCVIGATGSSTSPDPPNLDPNNWGNEDTLWIAAAASDHGNTTYTGKSVDFTWITGSPQESGGAGGAALAVTYRTQNNGFQNPVAFTTDAAEGWGAATIGIRPAAASGNATATPATVTAVGAIPAPTARGAASTAPSTVAATAAVPAPTARSDNTASPTTVAASGAVLAPTARGAAVTSPAAVAAIGAVPDPVATGGGGGATASPSTVAAVAAVPAPIARGAASTAPATVAAVAAVPAPTARGTGSASPAAVAAVAAIPASIARGAAIISPTTVAAIGLAPAPSASAGTTGTANPSAVAAVTTIPAPTVSGTARATPATVAALATVPAPAAGSSNIASPSTVAAIAAMPAVVVRGGAIAAPFTVAAVVTIPSPSFPGIVVGMPVPYAESVDLASIGAGQDTTGEAQAEDTTTVGAAS